MSVVASEEPPRPKRAPRKLCANWGLMYCGHTRETSRRRTDIVCVNPEKSHDRLTTTRRSGLCGEVRGAALEQFPFPRGEVLLGPAPSKFDNVLLVLHADLV